MKDKIILFVSTIILLIFIVDPLSWYYIRHYGYKFNIERSEGTLLLPEGSYKAEWAKKYAALEFYPTELTNEWENFKYKRMFFEYLKLKTEVDVYKKLSGDSSKLSMLYNLYDFESKLHNYTLEVYIRDANDNYYLKNRLVLNKYSSDSTLNDWKNR